MSRTWSPVVLSALVVSLVAMPVGMAACQHQRESGAIGNVDARAAADVAPAPQTATSAATAALAPLPSLAPLVRQLRPVVVNISSRFKPRRRRVARRFGAPNGPQDPNAPGEEEDPMERFFRFFGQPGGPQQPEQERHGLGSGFLIGDGLVLTNNHVVEIADENREGSFRPMDEIKVITDQSAPGGAREYSAKVLGADAKSDVAVLQLTGDAKQLQQLKIASLGDSDALEVGDYVVAIGEPFGLQATVTSGIISAKERGGSGLGVGSAYSDYLQTDAAINPGNSGGPLFNLRGEVIGVNAAIISGANTIGFAIPINVVKQILPQLKSKGRVARGYLGLQPQPLTQDTAEQLGVSSTEGALVSAVPKDAPAYKAGLRPGDVVVALNGRPIRSDGQLVREVGALSPGTEVSVDYLRAGKRQSVRVKLAPRPDEEAAGPSNANDHGDEGQAGDLLGVSVEDLTPQIARQLRLDPDQKGAVIDDVSADSPAGSVGLDRGVVIVELNREAVDSAASYRKAARSLRKGKAALIRVLLPGGGAQYFTVPIPK